MERIMTTYPRIIEPNTVITSKEPLPETLWQKYQRMEPVEKIKRVKVHGITKATFDLWVKRKGKEWMKKNHPEAFSFFTKSTT